MKNIAKMFLLSFFSFSLTLFLGDFFSSQNKSLQSASVAQSLTLQGTNVEYQIEANLLQSEYGVSFMHVNDLTAKKLIHSIEKGNRLEFINTDGVPEEYEVTDVIVSTSDELDLTRWGYKEKSLLLINSSLPLVNGLTNDGQYQYLYVSVIAEKASAPLLAGNMDIPVKSRQGHFLWDIFL